MATDINDLLETATADQIKTSIYALLVDLGVTTTSWQPGAVVRTIIVVLSTLLAGYFALVNTIAKSGFLDYAVGGWLTLLASLVYAVERVEATFATGSVTLNNAGGGLYTFGPGEFVCKASALEKTYTNTASFTLDPLETGLVVPIIAQEIGSASTASPAQIDTLVTVMTDVTVSNALAVTGVDAETDESLRERCRDSLGALSPNGPKSAYEYIATTPELVGGVIINRVKVLPPPGDNTLTVVIAGPNGAVSGGDVTAVQTGIDANATPEIGTVVVQSATNLALTFVVTLWVSAASALSPSAWQTMAKDALVAWVKTLPIGGVDLGSGGKVLFRQAIGVLENIDQYVLQASLTPESDTSLTSTQVATLVAGDVTVTVNVVS